jgi:hypothetical protein
MIEDAKILVMVDLVHFELAEEFHVLTKMNFHELTLQF